MTIFTHPTFDKHFKKRISPNKKLVVQFRHRLELFINNPAHPSLKDHQLLGVKKYLRSFSITGDIRVVYQRISSHMVIFMDIGTHSQIY